jgi:PHD/YefM family antitoxin component YafN of YafNO toxin-antitoxin module
MAILVSESEAMQNLPALVDKVRDESVIITDDGADMCAIVSMNDYELIRKVKNERLFAAMDSLGREVRENAAKQGISIEEVARMLDADVL